MAFTGFSRNYAFFEDQFERSDDGYLYRLRGKGPGYRVTRAERDAFVSRFKWSMRGGAVMILVFMLAAVAVLVIKDVTTDSTFSAPAQTAVTIAFIALSLIPWYFIYRYAILYPSNALAGRMAASPSLTTEEVHRKFFHKLRYWQLALIPFVTVFWLLPGKGHHEWMNPMHGMARLWWLAFAAAAGLAGVQAYRKWAFERNDRP